VLLFVRVLTKLVLLLYSTFALLIFC